MQSGRVLKQLLPGLGLRASILTKATAAGTEFDKVRLTSASGREVAARVAAQVQACGGAEEVERRLLLWCGGLEMHRRFENGTRAVRPCALAPAAPPTATFNR